MGVVEDYVEEEEDVITGPMVLSISWQATLDPPIQQVYIGNNVHLQLSRMDGGGTLFPAPDSGVLHPHVHHAITGVATTTGHYIQRGTGLVIEVTGFDRFHGRNMPITGAMGAHSFYSRGGQTSLVAFSTELNGVQINLHPSPRLVYGRFMLPLRATLEAVGMSELYGAPVREIQPASIVVVDGYTFIFEYGLLNYFGGDPTMSDDLRTLHITFRYTRQQNNLPSL